MYEKKAEEQKPPSWVETSKRLSWDYAKRLAFIEVPSALVGGAIGLGAWKLGNLANNRALANQAAQQAARQARQRVARGGG